MGQFWIVFPVIYCQGILYLQGSNYEIMLSLLVHSQILNNKLDMRF